MLKAKLTTIVLATIALLAFPGLIPGWTSISTHSGIAKAGTLFIEDFEDGSFADGAPVTWAETQVLPGPASISNGELTLGPPPEAAADLLALELQDFNRKDASARFRARVTEAGGTAVLSVRTNSEQAAPQGYFAGVSHFPEFGGSIGLVGRVDGFTAEEADYKRPMSGEFALQLNHDVTKVDSMIQLDAFGDQFEVRIWKAGDPFPAEPQYVFTDTTYTEPGTIRLASLNRSSQGTGTSSAIFSDIHVADMPIHEIPEPLACTPISSLSGDLDGDGTVAFEDFLILAANFGTDVDEYGNGDVNCDGTVAFDDFLALAENFGQSLPTEGPQVQEAALVPEPSMAMLAFIAFSTLTVLARRREY